MTRSTRISGSVFLFAATVAFAACSRADPPAVVTSRFESVTAAEPEAQTVTDAGMPPEPNPAPDDSQPQPDTSQPPPDISRLPPEIEQPDSQQPDAAQPPLEPEQPDAGQPQPDAQQPDAAQPPLEPEQPDAGPPQTTTQPPVTSQPPASVPPAETTPAAQSCPSVSADVQAAEAPLFIAQRAIESAPLENPSNETLLEYAAACTAATGLTIPSFDCTKGTEVPGQKLGPDCKCDTPNVLNKACDPGSRFQVLPGGNADAVAVAHCRKMGLPENDAYFGDIAVIAYNKKNGATCFFQALDGHLKGDKVPSPNVAQSAEGFAWLSPDEGARIGCTGCHDTGGFIRSPYLAQLDMLPSTAEGFNNKTTPVRYVGKAFADSFSWAIDAPQPACPEGQDCPRCNSCHRLAVNKFGSPDHGTAIWMAQFATAAEQPSKHAHSEQSPIWMRPGQILYDMQAEAEATSFHDCAEGFVNSGYTKAPPGCTLTPLAAPWKP
jgi:hypothetical protein